MERAWQLAEFVRGGSVVFYRRWEIVRELCAVVLGVLPKRGSHCFAGWDGMPGRLSVKGM